MKSAVDPYEYFRWKSSCGRLVVRTTWVKGVRHAILSDDDAEEIKTPEKERRQRLQAHNNGKRTSTNRVTPVVAAENAQPPYDDNDYVERVLQWLHKPAGTVQTRQLPMSAPGYCSTVAVVSNCSVTRRPALIKTCSIPENEFGDQQVAEIFKKKPTKLTRNCVKSHHKIELHVHMPVV